MSMSGSLGVDEDNNQFKTSSRQPTREEENDSGKSRGVVEVTYSRDDIALLIYIDVEVGSRVGVTG
jgi:hypothetical protein